MALVATPGRGFNFSRSCMARRPSGVAAFASPSMLAAMFITMEPIAGWLAGTSGNNQRMTGRRPAASKPTKPDFSARRMMPSQRAMMPASGSARVMTAVLQASKAAAVTSPSCPETAPRSTPSTTSPSQIQLSIGGQFVARERPAAQRNFLQATLNQRPIQTSVHMGSKLLFVGAPGSCRVARLRRALVTRVSTSSSNPTASPTSGDRKSFEEFPDRWHRRIWPASRRSICFRGSSSSAGRFRRTPRRCRERKIG